jgi:DEAD/DEAH box helicase domain-containing protein
MPAAFLSHLKADKAYCDQIVHVEHIAPRSARYGKLAQPLAPRLQRALEERGVEKLYAHQAQAINLARQGHDVVVSTGTASGKTLCYNIPVLQSVLTDARARALYLFPTKALAQDQLRSLGELNQRLGKRIRFGTYDGDTARSTRAALRESSHIILTNPDMLSVGILPNHQLWKNWFANLRYIVIDEAHVYRGVFGSQVACVLRRLLRVCEFYGNRPQFVCCSATIANPAEHITRLSSRRPQVVEDDGAPRGAKEFVLWNPPFVDQERTKRRSANGEAAALFTALVREGKRNITFARARQTAELILRYAREQLKRTAPECVDYIRAYRAGYLADERREIEAGLFNGNLLGVTATNALELGIDVGHLDATVLVGFPGTIASLWQQAGRAGRGTRDTLSFLIGLDDPLNQYFMGHPEVLFSKPVEHALIDPDNPHILEMHLPSAAFEVPLTSADEELFGPGFVEAMVRLERARVLVYRNDRWFYAHGDYPAEAVNLRSISGRTVALVDQKSGEVIEEIDVAVAPQRVHDGAIYLHQGDAYLVTRLDLESRIARLRPVQVDYYTETTELSETRILKPLRDEAVGATRAYFGNVRVTERVVGYRRKRQFSEEVVAKIELDYPPQSFDTKAMWWDIPKELERDIRAAGCDFEGALHAAEHACIGLLPLFAMCDRWDIGGLSTAGHVDTGKPQIFIYDGFPGGIGITEKGFEILETLWRATLDAIQACPCESGCPSCVQSPKCGNNNEPLDKRGAVMLLEGLLGESSLRK